MTKKTFLEKITEDKIENMNYLVRPVSAKERDMVKVITTTLVREYEQSSSNLEKENAELKAEIKNKEKIVKYKDEDILELKDYFKAQIEKLNQILKRLQMNKYM